MEGDPFLQNFDSSELKIAEEFLTSWLPFLTRGLCDGCAAVVRDRIQSLGSDEPDLSDHEESEAEGVVKSERSVVGIGELDSSDEDHVRGLPSGYEDVEPTGWDTDPAQESPKVRMSWADMAQQDELEEEEEEDAKRISLEGGMKETKEEVKGKKPELSREQRERIRFTNVGRKKDFVCLERVDGRIVNILDGLELHSGVFSVAEQKKIVGFVYELQERGKNKELGEHTYSEPRKWMRGKGRVTIQFGCCYNYAEKKGIPPGILRDVVADPIPNLFKVMIKRLIGWHVMPTSCVPDSCIINIYEPGDCIPPHIDSHDFVRPFCTVSFLSECNIVFGTNLKVAGAGEFTGSTAVALPVGSVLVLNGNGADVAKHCVPAVPLKRISITFRKMDKNKWPLGFELEPDLQNIQPYDSGSGAYSQKQIKKAEHVVEIRTLRRGRKSSGRSNRPKGRWDSMRNRAAFPVQANFMKRSSYPSTSSDSTRYAAGLQDHHWRSDEAEESVERSLHRGGIDEEGGSSDGNVVSNGRRVRVEQRRIIVTRNLDLEDDSLSTRIHNHDHPQVHIRTIKNNQRRLQVHK